VEELLTKAQKNTLKASEYL